MLSRSPVPEFCFAKLQISGSLKFSSDEIEVTKVEGARKGSIFWRPGSGVHVLFVSESVDLSPVRTMWNMKRRTWPAHPSCVGSRSLQVLAAGPRASTCEKFGTHANP